MSLWGEVEYIYGLLMKQVTVENLRLASRVYSSISIWWKKLQCLTASLNSSFSEEGNCFTLWTIRNKQDLLGSRYPIYEGIVTNYLQWVFLDDCIEGDGDSRVTTKEGLRLKGFIGCRDIIALDFFLFFMMGFFFLLLLGVKYQVASYFTHRANARGTLSSYGKL